MSAKFYPQDNFTIAVEVDGQFLDTFDRREIGDIMEKVAGAYPGQSTLIIEQGGFHAVAQALDKALELAGLDGLMAAKQQATGRVVF